MLRFFSKFRIIILLMILLILFALLFSISYNFSSCPEYYNITLGYIPSFFDKFKIKYIIKIFCPLAKPVSPIAVEIAFAQIQPINTDIANLKRASPALVRAYDKIKIFDTWNFINSKPLLFSTTTIGVIDTGIDASNSSTLDIHPEFERVNLGNSGPPDLRDRAVIFNPDFTFGHGTEVTGIIGANNLSRIITIASTSPQMNGIISGVTDKYVIESRTLRRGTIFTFGAIVDTLPTGSLVNMSFADPNCVLFPSHCIKASDFESITGFFRDAFQAHKDKLFIIIASNESINVQSTTPANINLPNTIIVGGTDLQDDRAIFSNFGSGVNISAPAVDVYAPAIRGKGNSPTNIEGVTSVCPLTNVSPPATFEKGLCNYKTDFSGTSAAAPMITGVAAILKAIKPTLTPLEIKNILTRNADPLFVSSTSVEAGKSLGSGCSGTPPIGQILRGCRLNALRAVQSILIPKPPKPYTLNPHTLFYLPLDEIYQSGLDRFTPELADTPTIPDIFHDCRIVQPQSILYTLTVGQFQNAIQSFGEGRNIGDPLIKPGQISCNNRLLKLLGNTFPDYTVGFWLKPQARPIIAGYIFFMVNINGDIRPIWILLDGLGRLVVVTHPPDPSPGNVLISTNPKIFDGNFHHYLAVFNHTQRRINLFIDGILDQSIPITTDIIPTGQNTFDTLLSNFNSGVFIPNAILDDFFVENRAWTEVDIIRFLSTGDIPLNNPHLPSMPDFTSLPEVPLPSFSSSTLFSTSTRQ